VGTDGADRKQQGVAGVLDLGLPQMGKVRADANLRYLSQGPQRPGPGRQKVTAQVVKTRITLQLATLDRLREAETEPLHPVGRLHMRR